MCECGPIIWTQDWFGIMFGLNKTQNPRKAFRSLSLILTWPKLLAFTIAFICFPSLSLSLSLSRVCFLRLDLSVWGVIWVVILWRNIIYSTGASCWSKESLELEQIGVSSNIIVVELFLHLFEVNGVSLLGFYFKVVLMDNT